MDALAKRSTSRAFDSKDLSAQQLSSLLWAAFGINRADGKRTAPSANNKQATDIYVLLKSGAYIYDAKATKLGLLLAEDIRKLGGTQDFVTNAPVTLVFVADLSKMGDGSEQSKKNTANVNVGYISQNVYLFCASEGLATGARGSVDRAALGSRMKLRPEQVIILAQSVGTRSSERVAGLFFLRENRGLTGPAVVLQFAHGFQSVSLESACFSW